MVSGGGVSDPHHLHADPDPDPACHFDADPDLDPTFNFDVDQDQDPDSDPSFQIKAENLDQSAQIGSYSIHFGMSSAY
jgi:hypothetical protein